MALTGKCKDAFDKFLFGWIKENIAFGNENPQQEDVGHFYRFPLAMQWGVYQDFFDNIDIVIEIQVHVTPTMQGGGLNGFRPSILCKGRFHDVSAKFGKRDRAIEASIQKANELFNKN